MSDLTVITVIANDGKSNLAHTMLQTLHKFTEPGFKLIVCDQGDNYRFISQYGDKDWVTVVRNPIKNSNTSVLHGSGLNRIFSLVETERTAIVESDCAILDYGWDDLDLSKHKMKAPLKGIGIDGEEYYFPCFMVFETDALKKDGVIDFLPSITEADGYIEVGGEKIQNKYSDVGWMIGQKIPPEQVKKLDIMACSKGDAIYFNNPALSYKTCEYWESGRPIAAHFWRGSESSRRPAANGKSYREQREIWRVIAESVMHRRLSDKEIAEFKKQT